MLFLNWSPIRELASPHGPNARPPTRKVMIKFIEGEYDVLVSTNIIESGLDIPNANTIMINQAHMFGLSDFTSKCGGAWAAPIRKHLLTC